MRLHSVVLAYVVKDEAIQGNRFTEMQFDFSMVANIVTCQFHR
jgi:hypothetical protein